jgi:hypothetical protein
MQNSTRKQDMRSLTASEIESVSGGLFGQPIILGDRGEVGCGTMVLLDNILKRFFPRR